MTYKPEWPSEVVRDDRGFEFPRKSSWSAPKEKKPDQDALRQRAANLYAGKNSQRTI